MGGRAVLSTSTSTVSFSRSSLRVCAKGKSQNRKVPGKAGPSSQFRLPPLDPNNPQFMIYVRSKAVPMWYPVSVITGGSTAKNLVNVRPPACLRRATFIMPWEIGIVLGGAIVSLSWPRSRRPPLRATAATTGV
jgi:hypothetical protein